MSVRYSSCRVCRQELAADGADDRVGGLCLYPTMSYDSRGCFERFWRWLTQRPSARPIWDVVRAAQARNVERWDQRDAARGVCMPSVCEIPEYQVAVEQWIELGAPDVDGILSHHLF